MEDTDGGLHPAVDGRNLDEDEDEDLQWILQGSTDYTAEDKPVPIGLTVDSHFLCTDYTSTVMYTLHRQ